MGKSPKPSSRGNSAKSSHLKSPPEEITEETKELWEEVKNHYQDPTKLILAVVPPNEKDSISKLRGRPNKRRSEVVVTSPDNLADGNYIQKNFQMAKKKKSYNGLFIIVSSAIDFITYNIPKIVKTAYIIPSGNRYAECPGQLRIGSSSTFCDFKTYAWDRRSQHLIDGRYKLTHEDGCVFEITDDPLTVQKLLGTPRPRPGTDSMSDEAQRTILGNLSEIQKLHKSSLSPGNVENDSSPGTSWFKSLMAIIAAAIRGSCEVAHSSFWYSSGGIYVKGSCGLDMAAGYFTDGDFGAVAASAITVGPAVLAGGAVYLIPWERVFKFLKFQLCAIWEHIKDAVGWFWNKLKELGSTVGTTVGDCISPSKTKPISFSM